MNKRRLLKLADELEALAKSRRKNLPRFDLSEWGKQRRERRGKQPTKLSCATAACAVGTAMLMPAFRKEGFGCDVDSAGGMKPTFKGRSGWEAAALFFFDDSFDAVDNDAAFLFAAIRYPLSYRSGKRGMIAVANRIRDFVAGKVSPPQPRQ